MARNSEKAMTALARWRDLKLASEGAGGSGEKFTGVRRRPFLAEECTDVRSCKRWRREIVQEISQKMAQIQNAGLGEFRLRDLNDEINKLIREKRHWEHRIIKLGGPNYIMSNKMLDAEGKELQWNRGYKYFGASKDLPGVKELFEPDPPKALKKTRAEYMRYVDAHYFGYMDEEDGQVMPLEAEAERRARDEALENYTMDRELDAIEMGANVDDWDQDIYANDDLEEMDNDALAKENGDAIANMVDNEDKKAESAKTKATKSKKMEVDGEKKVIEDVESASGEKMIRAAHVPVPSQEDVKAAMLRKKKLELLQMFAAETLSGQSLEAQVLLGL